MHKIIFFILGLSIAISGVSASPESDIELSLSKEKITLGEKFEATVTVRKSWECDSLSFTIDPESLLQQKNPMDSDIEIKGLQDFNISGTSISSQCQSINGKGTTEIQKIYYLSPKKTGHFTIGPAKAIVAKSVIESKTTNIEVINADLNSAPWVDKLQVSRAIEQRGEVEDMRDVFRPVFIAGVILLSLIVLTAWHIGRIKKEETQEGASVLEESDIVPEFGSVEDAEWFIREFYAKKTWEKTENRTYAELMALESDNHKRQALTEIFSILERMRYAGNEIDLNELNQRIKLACR